MAKAPKVVQSPVVQAGVTLVLAVVALLKVLGIEVNIDPIQVAAILTAAVTVFTFVYSRVSPVPKEDRGLKRPEDTWDVLARLAGDVED